MRLPHFSGHFRETVSFCRSTTASIVRPLLLAYCAFRSLPFVLLSQQRAPRYKPVAWRFRSSGCSSHGYRSHLWTVQEERKSLEWCHGLTSSFRSRPALRSANVPVLRARACLQRVDVLRTVSTHSPAFHHGGLSGEIARFGISHLCVDLVLVIGDCALQLRATGKHIF